MKEDLLKIVKNYGISNQVRKFNEECFELQEAIIIREQEEDISSFTDILEEHIAEELADCMVLIEQFKLYYNISSEEITEIFWSKVNRQLERIKGESNE